MKKLALLLIAISTISCQNNSEIIASKSSPVEIGSALMEGTSEMTPIVAGNTSNQSVWIEYIDAHNNRNLDKIAAINAEDWEGYTAQGIVLKGTEAHIEALDNWFKTASPKWEVKWMIANAEGLRMALSNNGSLRVMILRTLTPTETQFLNIMFMTFYL
ncbi:MAG: hypothetical protein O2934_04815 [Bacteroidetes bacterium]|nr:hypothetical protein [Bacteroidota bacterium]